jgi:hypothetical protein
MGLADLRRSITTHNLAQADGNQMSRFGCNEMRGAREVSGGRMDPLGRPTSASQRRIKRKRVRRESRCVRSEIQEFLEGLGQTDGFTRASESAILRRELLRSIEHGCSNTRWNPRGCPRPAAIHCHVEPRFLHSWCASSTRSNATDQASVAPPCPRVPWLADRREPTAVFPMPLTKLLLLPHRPPMAVRSPA